MISLSRSEQAMSADPVSLRALIRGVRGHFGRSPHPRTAFVLSGGASLGALQVGMLRALYERGIVPDLLVGASAGALNAAFVASRPQTVATGTSSRRSGAAFAAKTSSPSGCACSSLD